MKCYLVGFVLLAVLLCVLPRSCWSKDFEKTIPPEILRQSDPEVLDGTRPKYVTISQDMIWQLRETPDFGADVYLLSLDPYKLSSVQKEILIEWVKGGRKVLLDGEEAVRKYSWLFPCLGAVDDNSCRSGLQLAKHEVNTDCRDVYFVYGDNRLDGLGEFGPDWDVVVTIRCCDSCPMLAVAGRAPCGLGSVYFVSHDVRLYGGDAERWWLNFLHWMLDLEVPGAANRSAGASSGSDEPRSGQGSDQVFLKNGDVISGEAVTPQFTIATSYADLSFPIDQIASIVYEGSGQNIEVMVLHSGDRLSGSISPKLITIRLVGGQEMRVEKDKISRIEFSPKPN